MKGTYITIEIVLVAALLRFGEKVGTNNMWFVIVAIIVSHFVMEFLYELRKHTETYKHDNKKKSSAYTKSTIINNSIKSGNTKPNTDTVKQAAVKSIIDDTLKLNIDVDADTAKRDFFKMDIS